MNPRILKKLSKRAAPLLPLLGDHRKQFSAGHDDGYHGVFMGDRRHWDRSRCHPTFEGFGSRWSGGRGADIVWTARAGHQMVMRPPSTPLAGTMMIGAMSGGEEPEWDEQTAWEAIVEIVRDVQDYGPSFADIDDDYEDLEHTPPALPSWWRGTVSDYFRAAEEIAASGKGWSRYG